MSRLIDICMFYHWFWNVVGKLTPGEISH